MDIKPIKNQVEESSAFVNNQWARLAGPLVFLVTLFIDSPDPQYPKLMAMTGLTAWMAIWWMTECVHLSVTSLLPFLVLPPAGVADIKSVASQYMDPILFLFIGGFMLAFAIERWGLHKRLALHILARSGHSASSILAGIMITAWIISMWISNTATVMMLFAAVTALSAQLKNESPDPSQHRKMSAAFLIGLAYAASIGGMATLVGTPTNLIFYRFFQEEYGDTHAFHFMDWMAFALPASLLLLACTWFVLRSTLLKKTGNFRCDPTSFASQARALGPVGKDEKTVATVFIATALLWLTRAPIRIGTIDFEGWASLFPLPEQVQDGTVAVFMAVLLFLLPSRQEPGHRLLSWKETSRLPYEVILLFGSGFALSKGFESSGLSSWLAGQLIVLRTVPTPVIVLGICLVVTIISEFASNVASIQLVMPVLISMQKALGIDPLVLMLPAALAASSGFMLPVATAPNTIVYSSGTIKVREMAKAGLWTDLIAIALFTALCSLVF